MGSELVRLPTKGSPQRGTPQGTLYQVTHALDPLTPSPQKANVHVPILAPSEQSRDAITLPA
jgi:hypothetical protein